MAAAFLSFLGQSFFLPAPALTEKNCPDQTGRVYLVTGGYAGVGLELCKILYAHNATVWIAGRSEAQAQKAILGIQEASPDSKGRVQFLSVDLADLTTVRPAVQKFTSNESRLDVLVNNAGVMYPPAGSATAQGHELSVGTNCLGPWLLYQLLAPLLARTATLSPTGTVRVAWAGSIAVHMDCPQPDGMALDSAGRPTDQGLRLNYGATKVGNVFLCREGAKKTPETGVVHVAFNPGNLRTELARHLTGMSYYYFWILDKIVLNPAMFGAYTELYAAVAPEVTPDKSGPYVFPWGSHGKTWNSSGWGRGGYGG